MVSSRWTGPAYSVQRSIYGTVSIIPYLPIRMATSAYLMMAGARHNALTGRRLHGASGPRRHVPLSNDFASLPEDS